MGVLLVTGILKEITCLQAVADDEACKYGYESWIAYCYKTNIFTRFITICPCCKKSFTNDNPAVGGHVLAEYGRLNADLFIPSVLLLSVRSVMTVIRIIRL